MFGQIIENKVGTNFSNDKLTEFNFDKIADNFKSTKVIGLGESTHGTHEFSVIRFELFKYLIENDGFNTFFLEASVSSCFRVDDYIKGNDDDLYEIMVGLKLWPWQTIEMTSLINWMRDYNLNHPDSLLSFVGVDMRYNYRETIDELLKLNPVLATKVSAYNFDSLSMNDKKSLIDMISSEDFDYNDSVAQFRYQFLVKQLEQFYEGESRSRPKYFRDKKMAENIMFYLKIYKNSKAVYWAHNGHIKKLMTGVFRNKGRSGGHLQSKLKDKYYALGFDFKVGAFNVHHPDSNSTFKINDVGYSFGEVKFNNFSEYSLASKIEVNSFPVFLSSNEIRKILGKKYMVINYIGAKYTPRKYGRKAKLNYSRYRTHKVDEFNGIIYVLNSTPTKMIQRRVED